MDEVISFETKTYDQRLQEFRSVLGHYETSLFPSQIEEIWSNYLKNIINLCDWQAVWKISRFYCELLNVSFPTYILVNIDAIDFSNLSASISVLAVLDEINVPDNYKVSLLDLWPTEQQCHNECSEEIYTIADCLDKLRFFYTHLFMPWDLYESEQTENWCNDYLEERLSFCFDIRKNPFSVPYSIMEKINDIIAEVEYTHSKIKHVTKNEPENVHSLAELLICMEEYKGSYSEFSNPFKRKILIDSLFPDWQLNISVPSVYIVFDKVCTLAEQLQFLQHSKLEDEIMQKAGKVLYSLQSALQILKPVDTIILSSKSHLIEKTAALEYGGVLKGFDVADDRDSLAKITTNSSNEMFSFCGKSVQLENLTLDLGNAECCATVRAGCTRLINCHVVGKAIRAGRKQDGFFVYQGARLECSNCTFSGLKCAITASAGSVVVLQDCTIEKVDTGIRVRDNASVNVKGCSITAYSAHGISLETNKTRKAIELFGEHDSIDVFQDISNIFVASSVVTSDSGKPAVVTRKETLV